MGARCGGAGVVRGLTMACRRRSDHSAADDARLIAEVLLSVEPLARVVVTWSGAAGVGDGHHQVHDSHGMDQSHLAVFTRAMSAFWRRARFRTGTSSASIRLSLMWSNDTVRAGATSAPWVSNDRRLPEPV